jgi:L-lactate dehydrogenase complex protein LldE
VSHVAAVNAVLFHTCLVNEFAPDVGFSIVEVLERLGFAVHVPAGQTCCGQPAFNAGFHDQARVAARHTIVTLEASDGPIVIPSGSCGDMVIHQYLALFADDAEWSRRAKAIAERCVEFSVFVARYLDRLPPMELHDRVTYHPSCHLMRGLGVISEPQRVIESIGGVECRNLAGADDCCGFGGLFSVKHPDISARMLDRKLDCMVASGANRIVSCDIGCLLHIERGLQRRNADVRVQHLAELLAEALR